MMRKTKPRRRRTPRQLLEAKLDKHCSLITRYRDRWRCQRTWVSVPINGPITRNVGQPVVPGRDVSLEQGFKLESYLTCTNQYDPESSARQGLDCAHLFTRRKKSTRYFPEVCVALCCAHHRQLDSEPELKIAFAKQRLGGDYHFWRVTTEATKHWKAHELQQLLAEHKAHLLDVQEVYDVHT